MSWRIFSKIKFDPLITTLTFLLLLTGFAMFFSASLGVMARHEIKFFNIIQNQFLFGILLGTLGYIIGSFIDSSIVRILSPLFYIVGIVLCILVFVPGIGIEHGGARRWIEIFGTSIQPSEILKFASILLLGSFYYYFYKLPDTMWFRFAPIVFLILGVLIVLKEPDLGTSSIILAGIFSIFYILKSKPIDMLVISLCTIIILSGFYIFYPHAKERVNTFLFPEKNTEHQNYQVEQTQISIGSGGLFGDGYGFGIQKFHHLPEPVGDSIFAVIGEELGLAGCLFFLFLVFSLGARLIFVSISLRDPFEKSVLLGTGVVIIAQAFLNAGSSTGAIPFTGVPFPLVSHGSTSIIIIMTMLGLTSQISARRILN